MTRVEGPTVPGSHRRPWCSTSVGLDQHGYEEVEYLVEGEATGRGVGDHADATRAYRTRFLIRRPQAAESFNGKVLVEWMNVSGSVDIDISWPAVWPMLAREGWAYVGATVQPVGVRHLKRWDAERYGSLHHPGLADSDERWMISDETFSESILSDIGRALRNHGPQLFGATPSLLIAHGQSQSCGRLFNYIDLRHEHDRAFDAFLPHAGSAAAGLDTDAPTPPLPATALVLHVNSQAEPTIGLDRLRPDAPNYRYWEVAGSAHTPVTVMHAMYQRLRKPWDGAVALGPLTIEYALRAALHHLDAWVNDATPPPVAPRLAMVALENDIEVTELSDRLPSGSRTSLKVRNRAQLDDAGNAIGGVRLPYVAAPLGRYLPNNGNDLLMPGFVPFEAPILRDLYGDKAGYLATLDRGIDVAVSSGWLLPDDVSEICSTAEQVDIG